MDINQRLTEELDVKRWQIDAAVQLIDEGNTIPFISRYRKEATGELNDEQLRKLYERLVYLRNLEEKKEQVISSIEEQGKLTEELKKQILAAETLVAVEDLYRPYRPKRRTRATIAKEKGLEPLAALITLQKTKEPLEKAAEAYISEEKGVESAKDAISGACDIIAESISDEAAYRTWIRETTMRKGKVTSQAKDPEAESVYEMYYEFEEAVAKLAGHRILALNRGEKEKFLTVKVEAPEEDILRYLERKVIRTENPYTTPVLKETIADSYNRLIGPAIEREVRNELTEKAEDGAIEVFGKNLHQLLMQPPIAGKVVLGWDPAFRTGCKLAVVDETGKVIGTTVIYPTAPTTEKKIQASKDLLKKIIPKYHISLISLGNGTASRESEQFIVELLKEIPEKVQYVIVNEAGASVYSASKLATEEFPKFDVGQRSAASIARRLQDPLAELVKIDPKSIGVGQYQHDMNQKKLGESLNGVVEDCVNKVGVDLNTASAPLLSYISGISSAIAKNIVAYREENGRFTDRKELLKVPKLGPKAFEQCAGFLRVPESKNILDHTGVHPESYDAAGTLLTACGYDLKKAPEGGFKGLKEKAEKLGIAKLAVQCGVGEPTLKDIIAELEKQGITFKIHHCANSGAILDYPEMHLDMVRAGVILYGMEPSLSVEHHADFRPVLSLHSVISHVKEIEPGSDISYDRTFTAKERMRVATIPVGYADGYSRRLSNRGSVLIHGTRCPILGKVCMDHCMVDVSAVPQAKVGDTVTLIGRDGEDEITAAEIAGIMETIHYEVVCDISKRVTRVYLKNGKEVSVLDCILDKY